MTVIAYWPVVRAGGVSPCLNVLTTTELLAASFDRRGEFQELLVQIEDGADIEARIGEARSVRRIPLNNIVSIVTPEAGFDVPVVHRDVVLVRSRSKSGDEKLTRLYVLPKLMPGEVMDEIAKLTSANRGTVSIRLPYFLWLCIVAPVAAGGCWVWWGFEWTFRVIGAIPVLLCAWLLVHLLFRLLIPIQQTCLTFGKSAK